MKIFIYKSLFVFFCIFVLFQLTIGAKIKEFKKEVENMKSEENVIYIKNKVRDELKNAIKKDQYLSDEDAKLINEFLNKIKKELANQN
tara:strand:- start:1122 stop:1385 length:264 start_codon:yes stop_codon:yes gene_type:complete